AGIYGVATAWDATLRGLKVALIDKADFGNATSSNSLKIIHGGLRYLQQLDIKRMRESIRERMVLMHIAPNLVYPMPVIMPTYSYKMKSRPALAAALIANDIVGFDRNGLSDPHKYMPRGYTISKKKVQDFVPGYEKYNMNGGAIWYDCQCYNTERLLLSFVLSAQKYGADVANYIKSIGLMKEGNKVVGAKVQDTLSGNKLEIRAKMIVNNAGPWVDNVLENTNGHVSKQRFNLSTAMNLVVNRKLLKTHAAGLSGPYHYKREDGSEYNAFRILFFAPWRDYTIIGTNHLPYNGEKDKYKVTESEIRDFLAAVNKAYPAAEIKREEVTYFYGGFLPMEHQNPETGEVVLKKHYELYDHKNIDGTDGLITNVGVKYTTARDVAKKTVDLVMKKLDQKFVPSTTDEVRLIGGNIERFRDFLCENIDSQPYGLGEPVMRHLSYNYGSSLNEILKFGDTDFEWMELMPGSDEVLQAEIIHGVREEMAQKLSDVILRRTDLGSAMNPGQECLKKAADLMGTELGWDEKRKQQEIDEVNQIYIPAQE
ncbi:FAD-dependent oxidoreductase, partial [candidate division KSB1 bacterium]|nr:FAD-dependent oxidoreductase [candidate division KSB1 bacterium]